MRGSSRRGVISSLPVAQGAGRLIQEVGADGAITHYTYDARGLLTAETVSDLCSTATPTIVGTEGDDNIEGTRGDDIIFGLGGDDTIEGGRGNDIICGGPGVDTIKGDNGNDILIGGGDDDTLASGGGDDSSMGARCRHPHR